MAPNLLLLFVAVSLLAAGVLFALPRAKQLHAVVLFGVLIAAFVGGCLLIAETSDGTTLAHGTAGWPVGIAIPFVADMLTALMITVSTLLAFVCVWFAVASGLHHQPHFAPLVLVLMSGVYGALLTADLFNFFVFIEVMLLPSYGLYMLTNREHGNDQRVDGLRLYIAANLLASTMLLAGAGLVYATAGTVSLAHLAGRAAEEPTIALAMAVVILAVMIKATVVPVHSWLARTYPYTSPAVTALFSGLHTKVGVYALYRFYAVVYGGDERWLWIGVILFAATMVLGVIGAVGENDSRSILVLHMVSQIGYVLFGLALFTQLGLAAGIFYMIHNMVAKTSLFLSTGAVEVSYGTGPLGTVTGVAKKEPVVATAYFIAALALAGIPPMSGFVAKYALIVASWDAHNIFGVVCMVAVSLVTLISMLKIWGGMFWGDEKDEQDVESGSQPEDNGAGDTMVDTRTQTTPRIKAGLAAPAVITAALTIVIGLAAQPLLGWSEVAAINLLDTTSYVEALMNA